MIKVFPLKRGEWESREEVIEWLYNRFHEEKPFYNLFSPPFKTLEKGTKCILRFGTELVAEFITSEDMKTKDELITEKLISKSEINSDFNYRLYLGKDSLEIYSQPIKLSSYLEISGKKVSYQAYYNVDNEHYNLLMKKKK